MSQDIFLRFDENSAKIKRDEQKAQLLRVLVRGFAEEVEAMRMG
jgi:hypothetical protein